MRNRGGTWIDAPYIHGTFVINIGDMLALWSNNLFVSTPHRVINRSGKERYSIPVFYDPDPEVKVECLPNCSSANNPPRHAPVVAGDYILSRYDRLVRVSAAGKKLVVASSRRAAHGCRRVFLSVSAPLSRFGGHGPAPHAILRCAYCVMASVERRSGSTRPQVRYLLGNRLYSGDLVFIGERPMLVVSGAA